MEKYTGIRLARPPRTGSGRWPPPRPNGHITHPPSRQPRPPRAAPHRQRTQLNA